MTPDQQDLIRKATSSLEAARVLLKNSFPEFAAWSTSQIHSFRLTSVCSYRFVPNNQSLTGMSNLNRV